MMRMLKLFWALSALLSALLLISACPGKGAEKKDNGSKTAESDKLPFKVYTTGKPKYDRYFRRTHKLRADLWRTDKSVKSIPGALAAALKLPGDVKKIGFGKVVKELGTKYANKFLWKAGAGIQLKGEGDPESKKVLKTLVWAKKTLEGVPKGVGGAVNESKQLVVQGKSLSKSVKSDFKGMEAMKVPAVTAKLAESVKVLGGVPGQVTDLTKTSATMLKQLSGVFTNKK